MLLSEIFDLIIDAVSAEWRAMKTFSLVSRSFHSRARIHLFSQVILWVGKKESCRKRAVEFLRILKYKKNSDLISRIRSVKIVAYPREYWPPYDVEPDSHPLSSKGLLKLVGVDTDPIKTALTIFKNAPIEELILNESDGKFHDRTCKLLFEICSNPNLKALSFECIHDLLYKFIVGGRPAQKLTRLALAQVTISDDFQLPAPTVAPPSAEIETLELVRMTSKDILKMLRYLSHRLPSPISECFQNLKNLVITLPQGNFDERKVVWNVILGVAETLESLELRLSTAPPDSGEISLPCVYEIMTMLTIHQYQNPGTLSLYVSTH